jgi:dCMP deaminase
MIERKDYRLTQKLQAFADVAERFSYLSDSSRLRVGCISFRKDFRSIGAIGYNGNTKGAPKNPLIGTEEESLEPGQSGYLHAEENMIAKFRMSDPWNYIVLVTHSPCIHCAKKLINSEFENIYWINSYRETSHLTEVLKNVSYGTFDDLVKGYTDGDIVYQR